MSRKAEKKKARRLYWEAPIDSLFKRLRAYFHLYVLDHGFLRALYPNRFEIGPGVWRSSQPSPSQIAAFAKQGGKSIMTLRGMEYGGTLALEREAVERHGLNFYRYNAKSDHITLVEIMARLIETLESAKKPVLIHCKSGADRMGFVSVIYRHAVLGEPIEEARKELSARYLHFKHSRTGVLDLFFDTYEQERGDMDFQTWLTTKCDPEAINAAFKSRPRGIARLVDFVLRRE